MEKVLYEELTPKEFRERIQKAPIAYIPLGTLEWHGEHLPLGADGIQSQGFFKCLAKEVGGIVLPMLFLGPDSRTKKGNEELYGMDVCGPDFKGYKHYEDQKLTGSAYWVLDETFKLIIESTLKQLRRAGFKIVVAHGHGPSILFFKKHKDELEKKYSLKIYDCWNEDENYKYGLQVDHAGANETSITMALRPDLVALENLEKDKEKWPLAIGLSDPRKHASSQVGKEIISYQIKRMKKILNNELTNLE